MNLTDTFSPNVWWLIEQQAAAEGITCEELLLKSFNLYMRVASPKTEEVTQAQETVRHLRRRKATKPIQFLRYYN